MQRREQLAVGSRGTLSPLAEVGTKVLYPRIQEGGGEDADLAAGMTRALIAGLQGGPEVNPHSIWVTTKHWPGQGAGGEAGITYDGTTIHYHMRPWHAALEAGTSGIMPGYAGSKLLAPGQWGAGDSPGIINYLRQNMGYTHIIIGRKHADAPYHDGTAIWGDFDAQEIFSKLGGDLKIQPVKVGFAAYYDSVGRVDLMEKHEGEKPVFISGKEVRATLQKGELVDPRIMRESTSKILGEAMKK